IYGGYFGAGMGILMLAILAFLGLTNIHKMNGIKNIAATIINGVTIIIFVAFSYFAPERVHIDWPVAVAMVIGACIGGYGCSGLARKLPVAVVRAIVIIIGLLGAVVTAYKTWFAA
ncbi:MAG TPA: sulfite exporter TauE/SafE family protein, partial [Gemmatales bacterium]|nr:sulfite exporter TauE/SafE family protein [Gemmatales bacterium]